MKGREARQRLERKIGGREGRRLDLDRMDDNNNLIFFLIGEEDDE